MDDIIFTYMAHSADLNPSATILSASIRKFAGALSDSPIWLLVPNVEDEMLEEMKSELASLEVKLIPFEVEPEILKFPFASKAIAAATAESLSQNKTNGFRNYGRNSRTP